MCPLGLVVLFFLVFARFFGFGGKIKQMFLFVSFGERIRQMFWFEEKMKQMYETHSFLQDAHPHPPPWPLLWLLQSLSQTYQQIWIFLEHTWFHSHWWVKAINVEHVFPLIFTQISMSIQCFTSRAASMITVYMSCILFSRWPGRFSRIFWQQETQTNAFQSKTMHPLYMFTRQQLQTQSLSLFQDLVVLGHKRVACLEIFQSFLTLLLPLGSFQLPLLADLGEQLHLLFKWSLCPVNSLASFGVQYLDFFFQNSTICDSSLTPNLDISTFLVRSILQLVQWVFLCFFSFFGWINIVKLLLHTLPVLHRLGQAHALFRHALVNLFLRPWFICWELHQFSWSLRNGQWFKLIMCKCLSSL